MCSGGSRAPRAVITMSDTSAYDRQFEMQRSLIQQQMDSGREAMQMQLQSSLQRNQDMMAQIADVKKERAESAEAIEEEIATRNRVLLSTAQSLVPQQGAQGVVTGASRNSDTNKIGGGAKKSGKSGLRITRTKGTKKSSAGAGLNIT